MSHYIRRKNQNKRDRHNSITIPSFHKLNSSPNKTPPLLLLLIIPLQLRLRLRHSLLNKLLRHFFMSPLRRPIKRTDPRHLKLKVLILIILVRDKDDLSSCLDAFV